MVKIGHSSGTLFEPLLIHSGLRVCLTLTIALIVIASPTVMFANPALAASTEDNTLAPSTIGQDGSDFTTQAAISSLSARPTNNIVNTNSFYDVVFLTASSGAIKTIQVTFPAGTIIPSGAFFNEAEGIGPGTASKSGQTITYTVTNPVNVPAGTKIRLEFANINNPLNSSANYKVTVTTRDASNSVIDGPTQSTAYTIKQIGKNAIADGHITSTKPAESFMKRVTLTDNAEGNARGWNPNGMSTNFQISEPAITNFFGDYVSALVRGSGNVQCYVTGYTPVTQVFILDCVNAPQGGSQLDYIVIELPAHVS